MIKFSADVIDALNRFVNSRAGLTAILIVLIGWFAYPEFKELKENVAIIAQHFEKNSQLLAELKQTIIDTCGIKQRVKCFK